MTSLTVGTAYQAINPADGTAIIVGPVGIGTSAPVNNLHIEESVNSAVETQLLLSNSGLGNHAAGIGFQTAAEYTTYGPKAGIVFERQFAFGGGALKFFNSANTTTAAGFTAADERMRITQTGFVGIGTAAPTGPLHVNQDLNGVVVSGLSNPNAGNFATTGFRVGQDITTLGTQRYGELRYWGSGTPALAFGFGNPNQVGLITATGAVNGLTVATLANAPIKFLTNTAGVNNERMRIREDGRVLIGTNVVPPAEPTTMLTVRRDADERIAIRVENQSNTANAAARVFAVSQLAVPNTPISIGMDAFPQNFNPATIGAFAPGSTAISTFAAFGAMPATRGNLFIASRGPLQRIAFHTGNQLIDQNSERMRIQNNGQVGIGTPNPGYPLEVINSIYARRQQDDLMVRLGLQTLTSHWSISNYGLQPGLTQRAFAIATEAPMAPAVRLLITAAGRVGIGTNNPQEQLHVVGHAAKTVGGTVWRFLSDARLKQNIQPLQGALSKMLGLRGFTFEWKDPSQHEGETGSQMGLIAQETEKVFPQWVSEDDKGFKWLEPAGFDALSIEAMRELNQRIDDLKAANDALKQRIETLERKQRE
ncbi:MAG: tail fiber domain-containing protein [Candidatus Omnitrophota bacterium]|nr:tail fiber domain-containing protein [Candidatus Omnitrophota bacterium]